MKKRKVNIKKTKLFFLLTTISIITIAASFLILYFFFRPDQVVEYEMTLIISDHSGFDLNKTAITFGMVAPEGSSMRYFNIKNNEDGNKVIIKATGNIADLVSVSDNKFIIKPHEVKPIAITSVAPVNAEFGNYSGVLKINLYRK